MMGTLSWFSFLVLVTEYTSQFLHSNHKIAKKNPCFCLSNFNFNFQCMFLCFMLYMSLIVDKYHGFVLIYFVLTGTLGCWLEWGWQATSSCSKLLFLLYVLHCCVCSSSSSSSFFQFWQQVYNEYGFLEGGGSIVERI